MRFQSHLFEDLGHLLLLLLLVSSFLVQAETHIRSIKDVPVCSAVDLFERIILANNAKVCVGHGACSTRGLLRIQKKTKVLGITYTDYLFAKVPKFYSDLEREVHALKIMQGNKYFPRIECLMPAGTTLENLKEVTLGQPIYQRSRSLDSFLTSLKRISHRTSFIRMPTFSSSSSDSRVLVLKLVNSRDALSWLRTKLLRWPDKVAETVLQLIDVLIQFTEAVSQLHQRGLIHNDLKPGNLLVKDDQVGFYDFLPSGKPKGSTVQIKLIDFGSTSGVNEAIETAMSVPRTPEFVAPELRRDIDGIQRGALPRRRGTVQSDVYSVGKTMLILFGEVWVNHSNERIQQLEALCNRMVAEMPEDRISLREVKATLEKWRQVYARRCW